MNLAASAQIKAISQIQYFLVFKCVIKGRKKNSNFFQVYFFQKFLLSGSSDQTLNSDYTNPVLFTKFAVCYDHFIRKKANFQLFRIHIPYARHINPLLIRNRSWILTIHKARILRKKPLEKTFLDFQNVGKKYTNRRLWWRTPTW